MAVTSGFNHVGTVTRDLGRLVGFYRDAFGAELRYAWRSRVEPNWRHGAIDIGGGAVLHAFENPAATFPEGAFTRGRIDHLALDVPDEQTLEQVRLRLVEMGATDGVVSDFGVAFSVHFRDPDGMECEVACAKTGAVVPWPDIADMTAHTAPDPEPVAAVAGSAAARNEGWQ